MTVFALQGAVFGSWAPRVAAIGIVLAVSRRVPNEPAVAEKVRHPASTRAMARRPVLWLIAAIALFSAVAEGASADWSALFAVRERGLGESAAALVYAGFSV